MLVIRLQRVGRKGHAQFRVVVQDSRRTPTSGKIVAALGHYNPHTKQTTLDKEKTSHYLEHGAQPSDRVVSLLKKEGIKLPKWVTPATKQSRAIRSPEKLRRNRPAEPKAPAKEEPAPEEPVVETPAKTVSEEPAAEIEVASTESTESATAEVDETTPVTEKSENDETEPTDESTAVDEAEPEAEEKTDKQAA